MQYYKDNNRLFRIFHCKIAPSTTVFKSPPSARFIWTVPLLWSSGTYSGSCTDLTDKKKNIEKQQKGWKMVSFLQEKKNSLRNVSGYVSY